MPVGGEDATDGKSVENVKRLRNFKFEFNEVIAYLSYRDLVANISNFSR